MLKKLIYLFFTVLLCMSAAVSDYTILWKADHNDARIAAKTYGNPLLIYIYKNDDLNCGVVRDEVLKDVQIAKLISHDFIPIKADLEKENWFLPYLKQAGSYNFELPLFLVVQDDKVIDRHAGLILKDQLKSFLSKKPGQKEVSVQKDYGFTFADALNDFQAKKWTSALKKFELLDPARLTTDEKMKRFFYLGVLSYVNKDYDSAIYNYMKANGIQPEPDTYYNLACAYACKDDRSGALYYLEKAVRSGFKDTASLDTDKDLTELSATVEFKAIRNAITGSKALPVTQTKAEVRKGIEPSAQEKKCFDMINAMRAEKNLPQLKWAMDLLAVARAHSADMVVRNFFDHTNPDGLSPFDRIAKNKIEFTAAAENIAYNGGYDDPVTVAVEGWRNSKGHYMNIMTPDYSESAVGMASSSDGRDFFTQVFIIRK